MMTLFSLGYLTRNGISIKEMFISMKLLGLKYYSKNFSKKKMLSNYTLTYIHTAKLFFPKQILDFQTKLNTRYINENIQYL